MKNDFYDDGFELLLKEKADQFSMYPSKRVWHSIYNDLHPGRRWPSLAIGMLLITSLLLIGHLNTGDHRMNPKSNNAATINTINTNIITQNTINKTNQVNKTKAHQPPVEYYDKAFEDVITNETDFYTYTVVRNNRPKNFYYPEDAPTPEPGFVIDNTVVKNNETDIIQTVDTYIKSNRIFADITMYRKKKANPSVVLTKNNLQDKYPENMGEPEALNISSLDRSSLTPPAIINSKGIDPDRFAAADIKSTLLVTKVEEKKGITPEEKAWIENYALHNNKKEGSKFKNRLAYEFYVTPAVNYRKLTTKSKGSATAFANADINEVMSQKPGLGIETGLGFTYSVAKRLQIKAGLQFNYTNYNIDADKTNHPIITTILLNDPATGYSYPAARVTTISNNYNASALQPVTLHNRTYQVSVPVGFAYKLSSENNVDWFAGATVQPSYVFGGNAHLISSDLKSYVSDPTSIRSWNLNLGFETYMNFRLGASYNLQVGPQVRYQVYSTYRRDVALIEKPYAIGLKFGLTKGF